MKRCLACEAEFEGEGWTCPRCGRTPERRDGFLAFSPELAAESDGFPPESFALLARYEASSFWFEARNHLLTWTLKRWFSDAGRLLDVGCGTGFVLKAFAEALPHCGLVGTEVSSAGLALTAEMVPRAELMQVDARRLPFRSHFDVITACDVIEHIEDDRTVLSEMWNALRPGGGIVVTVPQHRWLWSHVDDFSRHKRRYTRRELVEKVRTAGFHVAACFSFVSLLLPALLASRAIRQSPESFDPRDEHLSTQPFNGLLNAVMSVERSLIRMGVRFPAGGSLLLVAHKPGATRTS